MIVARHYETDDLALFAMQLLSKDDTAAVTAHVEECPLCRQQLANLQGDLAIYAMTSEMHSPPALARERLMKQVAREKKMVPPPEPPPPPDPVPFTYPQRTQTLFASAETNGFNKSLGSGRYLTEEEEEKPKRNLVAMIFPWLGWGVAAGLALVAGNLYHERDALRASTTVQSGQIDKLSADAASAKQLVDAMTDPTAKRILLTKASSEAGTAQPEGRITYVPVNGTLIFMGNNLEPLETYKVYQLWLIPSDGRDPIPAGTFHPDERGNASVVMPPLPKGTEAKAFGVTIEDDGGSQTPTMPIVMAGS